MSEQRIAPPTEPPSILLVDDHEVVREGIAMVLGRRFSKCRLGHASSNSEAIEQVHESSWNLVITDLSINGTGGIDLIQEINSSHKGLPILVYTMHDEQEYGVRSIMSGASGFVRKGAGVKTLLEAVGQLLQGKQFISPELSQSIVAFIRKDKSGPLHEKLSDREYQVLCRIGKGMAIKEIGADLFLSVKTVSTYRARILDKLGLRNLADIVRYCIEHTLA
jgi:two-component system, NarL family, invasion response regulator UvrY